MKRKQMILVLSLCTVALLAGCGADKNKTGSAGKQQTVAEVDYVASDYVTLGDYMGIELNVEKAEVTDESVKAYVEDLLVNYPEYEETDKTVVEDGDFVNIDYEGKKDGVAFEGGTAKDQILGIGTGSFIDGFEDGLIGAKVGEERDLNLTFPDPYSNSPDLAGQPVVFHVKVNAILEQKAITYDTLTDEYVSEKFGAESVEAFIEQTKTELENTNTYYAQSDARSQLISELQKVCTVSDLPEDLINAAIADYKEQFEASIEQQGMKMSQYMELYQITEEDYNKQAEEVAKENLKFELILEAIAEKEKIELDEEGYQQFISNLMATYGFESEEALYETYGEDYVKETYVGNKVIDKILENIKINYTAPVPEGTTPEAGEGTTEEMTEGATEGSEEATEGSQEATEETTEEAAEGTEEAAEGTEEATEGSEVAAEGAEEQAE